MIKNLENGKRVTLKSNLSNEILKLTIQNENYVIINTKESLLVADLNSGKGSEILNSFTGSEKYDFSKADQHPIQAGFSAQIAARPARLKRADSD